MYTIKYFYYFINLETVLKIHTVVKNKLNIKYTLYLENNLLLVLWSHFKNNFGTYKKLTFFKINLCFSKQGTVLKIYLKTTLTWNTLYILSRMTRLGKISPFGLLLKGPGQAWARLKFLLFPLCSIDQRIEFFSRYCSHLILFQLDFPCSSWKWTRLLDQND